MKYGAELWDVVFLEVPSGAIWEVKLQKSNGMTWLKEGWNQFKEYYSIGRDITPENFVNIVGDASHKKAGRPETQNNSCDDIMNNSLRNKTAKVTKVEDHSYSKRQKSGIPVFRPNRVQLEKPDVEEDLSCATQQYKRKEIKEKL
ncbi:hypothetical protein RND71_019113 [Anisodus tanguticus]|uniref:TF-B3 domain-containing protein n=1 Tax=Anisodus tanguticus TaxID=243964 RepID=A0AAE1VDZ4_9SOLA|nr:hypothetical protein RND71_019113 [Anisodus tanguticus]